MIKKGEGERRDCVVLVIQGRYHEHHEGDHEDDGTIFERGCSAGPLKKPASKLELWLEKQPPISAKAAEPSRLREQQALTGCSWAPWMG